MRIAYCTNVRLPSEKAHGHQIAQVADAWVRLGHQVELFAPHRRNPIQRSLTDYYGIDAAVRMTSVAGFDAINAAWMPKLPALWITNAQLRSSYRRRLHDGRFDLLYTRVPALLPALLGRSARVCLELHEIPRLQRRRLVRMANRCDGVVCLTTSMSEELVQIGVDPARVLVEPDGVDLRRFAAQPDKRQARVALGIVTDRPVVGYVGRLTTLELPKGVDDLLKAVASLRSSRPVFCLIVGGPDAPRREYQRLAARLGLDATDVLFTGSLPAHDVPMALAACDLLSMPWPDRRHFRRYMSPLKMFEYMAASRPIVTSDLPTIRDVLDESMAWFHRPSDEQDLAETIARALESEQDSHEKSARARSRVERYDWVERVRRVLEGLSRVHDATGG